MLKNSNQRGFVVFRQKPSDKDLPQSPEGALLLVNSRISEQLAEDPNYLIQSIKLKNCSQDWNTFLCGCKFVRLAKRCYYKICPKCGKIRVMDLFDKFIKVFKPRRIARSIYDKGLRFGTFTIKNKESLEEAIEELYFYFKKLRNRKYWKNKVRGGVAGFHVTRGKDGLWNAHFHAIIDSDYLDMKTHKKTGLDSKLVQEWKHCTGGDGVLDIRRVKSHEGALRYLLDYTANCALELSDEDKVLFFKATFKRRLFFSFGKKKEGIYGIKFAKIRRTCPNCGCFYQYVFPLSKEYELAELYFNKRPPDPNKLTSYIK